jgi:phage baseplate assembly protein gpV
MEGHQAGIRTAMPGVVSAVDLDKQTVSVQPSVRGKSVAPDGTQSDVNLPLLVDVPICWPRGGGFALTLPVAVGDECLVVFGDRCIDSWWQSGGTENVQAEARMHDLSDGFAIMAPTSQPKRLSSVSTSNAQLRDEDGTTYIEINPNGGVRISTQNNVDLFAPNVNVQATTVDVKATNVTIDSSSTSTIKGGTVKIEGAVVHLASSAVDFGVAVTTTLSTHTHEGVTTGSGVSGPPIVGS